MSITFKGQNIIGSSFSSQGKKSFQAFDPSTKEKLEGLFMEATPDEIDSAVNKAADAFLSYRTKSGIEKASFLENIADEIMKLGDFLIQRCMLETGLPEGRLAGERMRTVNQLKLFADVLRDGSWVEARIDTADPERKPLPKPDVRSMLRPLGPVGVFGASNFPLAFSVAGGDTVSALAAGCTVVVKAHPSHPGTSELIGLAIQRAVDRSGMPDGTFCMVHGPSVDVGLSLVQHPHITAIGFTGSFRGGKALFDAAAKREVPIPVYAEMGSTNPVFILPGALREKAQQIAQDLTASVTLGSGQFCTNPGLVFLEASAAAEGFKNVLKDRFTAIGAGIMLNESIHRSYHEGIKRLTSSNSVSVLAKGAQSEAGCRGTAYLLETRAADFLNDPHLEEEVFGPSTLTVSADKRDDLLQIARKLRGHLTATIHGTDDDLREYRELIEILEQKVGRILINGYPTGVEVCHAMVHGGPYPATTDSKTTSVGTLAIKRFSRAVCYQHFPDDLLPDELRTKNPLNILRMVNGNWTK